MSLRLSLGALIYDWPRFSRVMHSGRWELMHNRDERISTDGRGVKCEWRFTSDLHIAKVFPRAGMLLMAEAFREWPVVMRDEPAVTSDLPLPLAGEGGRRPGEGPGPRGEPVVSFIVGHRGLDRLPHLLTMLRSIAGQSDLAFECIVVEQGAKREVEEELPPWVRYVFQESGTDYNRSAAFNHGANEARGRYLVMHDNDMIVPSRYAAEIVARGTEGYSFMDLKRFLFNLDEATTAAIFATQAIPARAASTIVQNAQGGSVAVERGAYFEIGGFDEEFVGWGGEDNDFWDRAATTDRMYQYGYLPMIHVYHPPQAGKLAGEAAPATQRYRELETIPATERIRRLLERRR